MTSKPKKLGGFFVAFQSRLKELRRSRSVTQKQAGEAIGSNERAIRHYELGTRRPEFDALIALANFFDVSLDYLVGRTDNPDSHKF